MARAARLDLRAFQQELASRLATKTAAQVESSRLGLACGGDRWLMRLADAGEVVAMPDIVPVPLTKPWYLGIANIRGNLYSVVDFARYLGRESEASSQGSGSARLVLFGHRAGDMNAGLVVTRVLGLRNVAELAPAAPPQDAPAWYAQRWMDGDGNAWQEIDLSILAKDTAFLTVGL
jgi:twitching motility protein PilI